MELISVIILLSIGLLTGFMFCAIVTVEKMALYQNKISVLEKEVEELRAFRSIK